MTTVVVYSRDGCHLCEDLVADLAVIADEHGFAVEVRDIDDDPELKARYHARVPVVEHDGEVICEYFLDPAAVRARLVKYPG